MNEIKEVDGIEINGYSNHLVLINSIFKKTEIKSVFEYGCGFGSTPYFCKNAESVIALEMQSEEWFLRVRNDLRKKHKNLEIHCKIGGENWDFIEKINETFDFVFVDGHGDSRPDCINLCFRKNIPIIVSHDTEESGYKWERVNKPAGYESYTLKMFKNYTTVWTNKMDLLKKIINDFL